MTWGAPAQAQSIYKLDGDVSPAGDPEALALTGLANGTDRTYWARGPQVASPGSLLLSVSTLKVNGRFTSAPLNCSSHLRCKGRLSITTKAKIARHKKLVVCDTTSFNLKAGRRTRVKLKISARCLSLLHQAHGHHIKAQFTDKPSTGQARGIKNITLHL